MLLSRWFVFDRYMYLLMKSNAHWINLFFFFITNNKTLMNNFVFLKQSITKIFPSLYLTILGCWLSLKRGFFLYPYSTCQCRHVKLYINLKIRFWNVMICFVTGTNLFFQHPQPLFHLLDLASNCSFSLHDPKI